MLAGVFRARKKDGCLYFRSSITYRSKHISLGSFTDELHAHYAYLEADRLLQKSRITITNALFSYFLLSHEKVVSLLNFRDNGIYIKTPVYMFRSCFHYYLTPDEIYKFDTDDLFYFSSHKLLRRGGHLYVNDYGMQVTVLSRYGIRNFAVAGKDYKFANQDPYDLRYENIININPFHGVRRCSKNGTVTYDTHIHINGEYQIGNYKTLHEAAIAYNKAADLARQYGAARNFPANFIAELSKKEYEQAYADVKISDKYKKYLKHMAEWQKKMR